ncbi:MAG: HDOD domain-containing protein [Planctomycetaceae bacterium]
MSDIDWTRLREETLGTFTLTGLPPTLQLPALPHAVTTFIERSKDSRISLKDLAGIVETDAGLTLELLKHVNSAFVGLRQKAKTVQQAISLLGLRQSRLYLIAAGTQAAICARKSKLLNQTSFWNSSLQKALFAREVAKLLGADTDVAFAGALLQDYLLPILSNELYESYVAFVDQRPQQSECLCDYERQTCGWDHAAAAASLAHRWKLPDDLVCCILFHHRGLAILADRRLARSPASAVALSALLPDQLRQQYYGLEQLVLLQQKWPAFHLEELVAKVDEEHAASGLGIANDFPLSRRCQQILSSLQPPAAENSAPAPVAV